MAVYPCTEGNHRYGGAQKSAYVTHVNSSRPETRKARLCQRHFDSLLAFCDDQMDKVEDDDGIQMSLVCQVATCTQPRACGVFVKLFPGGEDYMQYALDLCDEHATDTLGSMGWDGLITR